MINCASCGADVTGKKFCPQCGIPVQAVQERSVTSNICPRCNGEVKPGAAFCMHCGSALQAQTAPPPPPPSATSTCPACHVSVPIGVTFCTNCGHDTRVQVAPQSQLICPNCRRQNGPDVRFCGGCGSPLGTAQPGYMQSGQYQQSQYQQPQYQQPQYQQSGYQPQPMMGQPPMVLRCPTCMAMAPLGTASCVSCRTNLAGVVPVPANMPPQGQQGGLGGFMQGNGGKFAMGALGGAAAVIGGEMLLHGVERSIEGDMGFGRSYNHRGEGLLGELGELADDIGL